MRSFCQPDQLELVHQVLAGGPDAAHAGKKGEVFPGRQVFIKVRPFDDGPYPAEYLAAMGPQIHPKDLNMTRGRGDEGEQHSQGRRLAGAVLAQKTINVSRVYREGKVVYRMLLPKKLGQARDLDDGGHRRLLIL